MLLFSLSLPDGSRPEQKLSAPNQNRPSTTKHAPCDPMLTFGSLRCSSASSVACLSRGVSSTAIDSERPGSLTAVRSKSSATPVKILRRGSPSSGNSGVERPSKVTSDKTRRSRGWFGNCISRIGRNAISASIRAADSNCPAHLSNCDRRPLHDHRANRSGSVIRHVRLSTRSDVDSLESSDSSGGSNT